MIIEAIKKLSYALLPRRCPLCSQVVELDSQLCSDCENNEKIIGQICPRCASSVDNCKCTIYDKFKYECVVAPFYFKYGAVSAVHRLKFYGYSENAVAMSKEMANTVCQRYSDVEFDVVTYVPMTKKRLNKRGYNQSKLLADGVAQRINLPCETLLEKVKETSSQRGSTAVQRRKNLKNAFKIVPNFNVKGKTILIVDDVKTTGSTLNECAKVLCKNGAKAVYACTFAAVKLK
jgi:ComF family protein